VAGRTKIRIGKVTPVGRSPVHAVEVLPKRGIAFLQDRKKKEKERGQGTAKSREETGDVFNKIA